MKWQGPGSIALGSGYVGVIVNGVIATLLSFNFSGQLEHE